MRLFEALQPLLESKVEYVAKKYMKGLLVNSLSSPQVTGIVRDVKANIKYFQRYSHDMGGPLLANEPTTPTGIQIIVRSYIEVMPDEALETTHDIVETFAETFDPTPNNKYLDWISRMYATQKNPGDNFYIEDYEMVADVLSAFHKYKKRLDNKDINQYKSFTELKQAVNPFLSAIGEEKQIELIGSGEAEVIYERNSERIIIPHTVEAAKAFSKGTEWCTQYPKMFKQYASQGPIYIIDTPDPDDRIQVHFESSQIMDINDDPIDFDSGYVPSAALGWLLDQVEESVRGGHGNPKRALFFLRNGLFTLADFSLVLLDMKPPEKGTKSGIMLSALPYETPDDEETKEIVIDVFKSERISLHGFRGMSEAVSMHNLLNVNEYTRETNEFLSLSDYDEQIEVSFMDTMEAMIKYDRWKPNDVMDAVKNSAITNEGKVKVITLILQFLLRVTTPVDPNDDSPIAPDWYVDLVKKEGILSISNKRILGIFTKNQFIETIKDFPNNEDKKQSIRMFIRDMPEEEQNEVLNRVGMTKDEVM